MTLFLIISSLTLLWGVPTLDVFKLSMDLASGIYAGAEDDFSYLDGRGGTQLINEAEHSFIPKFSLWLSPDNVLFLIVRGSVDLADWVDDLIFIEIENETLGAHFHSGFWGAATGIWNEVGDTVKKVVKNGDIPLYITGHSLGASTSEILHVIARRDILDSGIPYNVQSIAFAPVPAMSPEGDVLKTEPDISVFVHDRDIVPLLYEKELAELAYNVCAVVDTIFDNPICEIIDNKDFEDFIAQFFWINTTIGGNIFWLQYDCAFLDFDCKVMPDLKDAWSDAEQLEQLDFRRLSILNGTAFGDHGQSKYHNYISQLTSFSLASVRAPTPIRKPTPTPAVKGRKFWRW